MLDAVVAPQDIKFPTYLDLLNKTDVGAGAPLTSRRDGENEGVSQENAE